MKKKHLKKEIKKLRSMLDVEIDANISAFECFKSVVIESNILKQSLASCENALREKEIIITYLETRGN